MPSQVELAEPSPRGLEVRCEEGGEEGARKAGVGEKRESGLCLAGKVQGQKSRGQQDGPLKQSRGMCVGGRSLGESSDGSLLLREFFFCDWAPVRQMQQHFPSGWEGHPHPLLG